MANRKFRIVFMRKNEDPNDEHMYYFDGVTIETDEQTTENIFVDLINKFNQYVEDKNIEDVSVNEIYEEE